MQKSFAMVPARLGSQRLPEKNLRQLAGTPLVAWAIRKSLSAGVFDQVWVNSESEKFEQIARQEGARFHRRPAELASNTATSEDYIGEFLERHECDLLFQVHSIAPLLTAHEVGAIVNAMRSREVDVQLSVVEEQIECAYRDQPVNFGFGSKTNSQELEPIQRVTWSITGWRREAFLAARRMGRCATYAGPVAFHPISRLGGLIIKTDVDLQLAEALFPLIHEERLDE